MFLNRFQMKLLVGILCGFLLSGIFMYISFITAIHDGFRIAAYLFPVPVLISPDIRSLKANVIIFALIQWPLYVIVFSLAFKNHKKPLAAVVVIVIIIQHIFIGQMASAKVWSIPVRIKLERDLQ